MAEEEVLRAIGHVRSSLRSRDEAPRQGRDSRTEAVLEILPEYAPGLEGLDAGRPIQVMCWMHLAPRDVLTVHPRGDADLPMRGVFATRSPARPNPIASYVLDLISIDGLHLRVRGIDALDGTPVLDIRPHIHRLDD